MQIVFLGSGGYHPNSRRHTACVMLPEIGVVFDAGTGAFRIRDHLATDRLDIFLSHAHLDHVFGLTSLIGLFKGDDPARIKVYGAADKLEAVSDHLFSPLLFPVTPNFTPVTLADEHPVGGNGRVTSFALEGHPGDSVGYRLDLPRQSIAYITDTVACADANYVESIKDVDLLIHEGYFEDDQRALADLTGHSCLSDVVDVALAAQAKRLVLVHMNPRVDCDEPLDLTAARQRMPEITIANDGDVIDLG